jgi:hypothetical protein
MELLIVSAMSKPADWQSFLKKFADAANIEEWPGNPGASEGQLLVAEKRLKVKFPPSYRAFLTASNGWLQASRAVPFVRPVEDICWFRKEHRDWYEAYQMSAEPLSIIEQDYFNYAQADCVSFDFKHLAQTLCVSEIGDDAVLLLNPMVVWPDGEWEAWFFANWLPGAARYRSFADWMRQELDQLLNQPFTHTATPGELPTVYLDAPGKPNRRIRPREEVLVLETVLERLRSKKKSDRVKATQQLGLLGGKQAVDALLDALKNDPEKEVRWRAADSLGLLGAPEAVEALIAAIDDPLVNTTAIHALAGFKDERSAQCLLKILEEGGMYATSATNPLVKRGDVRAIKHLVHFLTATASDNPRVQHIGDIAGRLISPFEDAGYVALEPLMVHPDIKVRHRAILGISDIAYCAKEKIVRRKAYELLQRFLETDTDTGLRQLIEVSITVSTKKNLK